MDQFQAEQLSVELAAAREIADCDAEVNDALRFDHVYRERRRGKKKTEEGDS